MCNILFFGMSKINIDKLQRIQNAAIRVIQGVHGNFKKKIYESMNLKKNLWNLWFQKKIYEIYDFGGSSKAMPTIDARRIEIERAKLFIFDQFCKLNVRNILKSGFYL